MLGADDAEIHGRTASYDWKVVEKEDYIGSWTGPNDYLTWMVNAPHEGRYRVEVSYAFPANGGARFTVRPEGGTGVSGTTKLTKTAKDFRTDTVGEIELRARRQTLAARIVSLPAGAGITSTKCAWCRFR